MRPLLLAALIVSLAPSRVPLTAQGAAARAQVYQPGVDVLHYDLTLDLPERGGAIEGRAALTLLRRGTDTLLLDLIALRVDSVLVNDRPVSFGRDATRIRVPIGGAGDSLRVTVRYGGAPQDGLIIRTDSTNGRWTAFGDNWPNRARHWIPSVDHPSDKATVTWSVRAPSSRTVVANGELVEESPLSGPVAAGSSPRTLTRWTIERPIPTYLMVIAAAPLARVDLGRAGCGLGEFDPCVRQSVYVAPELRDYVPGPFARAHDMVRTFGELVAAFPYEQLAHLQSSTRFGGMENATAIFYSDGAFRRRSVGVTLIAHETAHQWFGNSVTPRDWPHVWLSEGFATYFAQLYHERSDGAKAFQDGMRGLRETVIKAAVVAQRPVVDSAQANLMSLLNANSYQKGGFVLHMLRDLVGDSAFFRGVRTYYRAGRHGTAVTDDLQREMEAESGQDLRWFFDQWLRRPGYVEATTSWRHDAGAGKLILTIEQSGRFGAYRFPLTVALRGADGSEQRVRVEVPADRRTEIGLPLVVPARPAAVVLDPDVTVLGVFTNR